MDKKKTTMQSQFYSFQANGLKGEKVSFSDYQGKVVLIVNTASKCGFTPQFEGLEALYRQYKDQDFVILGFPSNQFANQEPGDEKAIANGCVVDYDVTFPMFSKIDVNGEQAHPLYKYLKRELSGLFGERIKWNFTKFLIDRDGKPVKRFSPYYKPKDIEKFVTPLL